MAGEGAENIGGRLGDGAATLRRRVARHMRRCALAPSAGDRLALVHEMFRDHALALGLVLACLLALA